MSVTVAPTSVSGPSQGSVMPAIGKTAPTAAAGGQSTTVAFSWLGLVLLLIILRLLQEWAR